MFKNIIKLVFHKLVLINISIIATVLALILIMLNFYLDSYTLNGKEITVPDLADYSVDEIEPILKNRKLRYNITDSAYVKGKAPFVILDQNPEAGSKVKENRQIYITVNAKNPPKVELPNILDQSHRIAIEQLKVVGLKTDSLIYRPHFARDAVIAVLFNNSKISAGFELIKGSEVSLVVGMGTSNEKVNVPNLKGLTVFQADELLMSNSLNLGKVRYDDSIEDTSSAQISNQYPKDTLSDGTKTKLNLGSVINIWVTQKVEIDTSSIDNLKTNED
tara:strand:- start:196 stop:1023 length:828 start_codon:yes stop_codon:yes gene_type:complete